MNFVSVRIITENVDRMVAFYENVTQLPVTRYTEDFAEVITPSSTLAIAHSRTIQTFGAGAAQPADNHSVIIEFLVDDVDSDYERLGPLIGEFVQEPTTQPWGNRSLLFRDPDGNLLNLFTPVTPEAIKKFSQ